MFLFEKLTIAPRAGRELGYVWMKMDNVKFREGMLSRQSLLDHFTVQLASRAADELWYGEHQFSIIWAETAAARTFVLGGLSDEHYGLSDFWITDRTLTLRHFTSYLTCICLIVQKRSFIKIGTLWMQSLKY